MSHKIEATGALSGLRVVDLSRVLGGPYAGQVLGDHGAEVIKIEPPAGDETREWGPPFQEGTASYFLGLNRNKRAISLDLRKEEGRMILMRLLENADVLVENFKTGTLEKWGIGYDVLSEKFPKLIHCQVSGFGADGPMGGMPGYDAILQAMSGIMSVNGTEQSGPTRVGLPVVDMVTGLNAVLGILLALRHREKTGKGQFIEAALFDTALSLLHPHGANYSLSGNLPKLTGNDHPNISPYSTYKTGTRPIYLAVGNDRQFANLCDQIDAPHIANDPRFNSNGTRVTNRDELRIELEKVLTQFDGNDLAEKLIHAGVPAGPVLNVEEALAHPHTAHRKMTVKMGDYTGLGAPVKPLDSLPNYRKKPPKFAEHTQEILIEAGYSKEEIQKFIEVGITPIMR